MYLKQKKREKSRYREREKRTYEKRISSSFKLQCSWRKKNEFFFRINASENFQVDKMKLTAMCQIIKPKHFRDKALDKLCTSFECYHQTQNWRIFIFIFFSSSFSSFPFRMHRTHIQYSPWICLYYKWMWKGCVCCWDIYVCKYTFLLLVVMCISVA